MPGNALRRLLNYYGPGPLLHTGSFRILPLVFLVLLQIVGMAQAQVSVPITVQEALYPAVQAKNLTLAAVPTAATGIARTNEPFTVGIPIPDSWNITSESQLGLTGASVGQFKILAHWPSGHAKWVLIDSQLPSLSAGAVSTGVISLVGGAGNFGGSNLAADSNSGNANSGTITINTGTATFV